MFHLLRWISDHWSAVGYVILFWVVPMAIVYLTGKFFNRGFNP